jgi:hypothetical protein
MDSCHHHLWRLGCSFGLEGLNMKITQFIHDVVATSTKETICTHSNGTEYLVKHIYIKDSLDNVCEIVLFGKTTEILEESNK